MNEPIVLTRERIPVADRRAQILAVAGELFGVRGYAGTTTDQVARAAGISQPYVVRMFGSKEQLFVEAVNRARGMLLGAFRAVLVHTPDSHRAELGQRLGHAYVDLVADRGIMRILMQAFLSGSEPTIGPCARDGLVDIYRFLRDEAGMSDAECVAFLAHGMLLNTLLGVELEASRDPDGIRLMAASFGDKIATVTPAD